MPILIRFCEFLVSALTRSNIKMTRLATLLLAAIIISPVFAEKKDSAYQFETIIDLKTTSVKNQHRSGTCWSFSANSFIESEVLRIGGDELDLS